MAAARQRNHARPCCTGGCLLPSNTKCSANEVTKAEERVRSSYRFPFSCCPCFSPAISIAMPGHDHCIAPNCSNRRGCCKYGLFPSEIQENGRKVWTKRRLCGSADPRVGCGGLADACKGVSFHCLPRDSPRRRNARKAWLAKIPRSNIPLSGCVCGIHFPKGKPEHADEPPTLFLGKSVAEERQTRVSLGLVERPVLEVVESDSQSPEAAEPAGPLVEHDYGSVPAFEKQIQELKAANEKLEYELKLAKYHQQETQNALEKCQLHYKSVVADETKFLFYTGLPTSAFQNLLDLIKPAAMQMSHDSDVAEDFMGLGPRGRPRALCIEDELFLTVVKLRHDFPESDLAVRFGITQATVSRIFSAYIRCLYFTFQEVSIWPSRQLIDEFMPTVFKDKYPHTRVVIDATEFPIEKPANPDVQAATWSNYKGRNTFKLLVGVSPNGSVSFISPLYGGRISDKELTKRSGLLSRLEPGDTVMADRGFDIASQLPEGTGLNIPPFLGSRDQLENEEVVETRRIASVRIHVERAMERIKNFRITHFFPAVLCPLAEHIIYVCTFLTLYMEPSVPPPRVSGAPPISRQVVSTATTCSTPKHAAASTLPKSAAASSLCDPAVASGLPKAAAAACSLTEPAMASSLCDPDAAPDLPKSAASGISLPTAASSVTESNVGCFSCGLSIPGVRLRRCRSCHKEYHHMCQTSDEEGRLCNICFLGK